MGVARLFPRSGHSRRLQLSFILGCFFAAFCKEGDRPAAADLSKLQITLQRGFCLGSCPAYDVTIHGDGQVVFTGAGGPAGMGGVLLPGTHEDRIDAGKVDALFKQFREAGFFNLRSSYLVAESDTSTDVLVVDTGQRHKSVRHQWGARAHKVFTELEGAVDKAAGASRWVRGSAGLIAWLEEQNFDFSSTEAAQLAASGARGSADEAMVLALVDRGAPLDSEVSASGLRVVKMMQEGNPVQTPTSIAAGFSLMESAISRGQAGLFNALVAAGWLDRLGEERAAQLVARSAAGCSPALVDAAANAGIDIDKAEAPGGLRNTALANLATVQYLLCRNREADRVGTAERLLARGADPNHRDARGHTPLYDVKNPDMVKLLLAHGAERR